MDWIPVPTNATHGSQAKGMPLPAILPSGYWNWKEFQQSRFWNLFWALANAGGYLPFGSDIWKLSGALTRERWESSSSAVLAAFEFTMPDASGRVQMFYRPLLEIIETQAKKYRNHKPTGNYQEISTVIHKRAEDSSLSLDFDLKKEEEKKPVISQKLADRLERERRDRLTRARKIGLRDFNKYPLEDWEKPQAIAAMAGD